MWTMFMNVVADEKSSLKGAWSGSADQGSFSVRKRTGTLRIWRAREREPIWGPGGGAPSGVQGQSPWSGDRGGEAP